MHCGESALLHCDGVDIFVISIRHQAFGTELFTAFGVDLPPTDSSSSSRSTTSTLRYRPIASEIVYTSPPGALTMDPREVTYSSALTEKRYPWVEDPWT